MGGGNVPPGDMEYITKIHEMPHFLILGFLYPNIALGHPSERHCYWGTPSPGEKLTSPHTAGHRPCRGHVSATLKHVAVGRFHDLQFRLKIKAFRI